MTASHTPSSATERKRAERLDIARRLYQALVAQNPDRVITLCDSGGRVAARHDPRPVHALAVPYCSAPNVALSGVPHQKNELPIATSRGEHKTHRQCS